MVNVYYANINSIEDHKIGFYRQLLPEAMRSGLLRYRLIDDQKARLLARLMLLHQLNCSGSGKSLDDWQVDKAHKPFIENWSNFNIAHAGEWVVFCCSDYQVGIDIEQVRPLEDLASLSTFFTAEEKQFVMDAAAPTAAFYEVWVKKEACLKALGVGLSVKLNSFSCLGEMVRFDEVPFFFTRLFIHQQYVCYVSCSIPDPIINLKQFHLNESALPL